MKLDFNYGLFAAVQPTTLKEFWERVMYLPLPSIDERAKLFQEYNLGNAIDYLGTDNQNMLLLEAFYHQAGF